MAMAAAGRLDEAAERAAEVYRDADMIFICVGTPTGKNGETDMSYVWSAADDIGNMIKKLGPGQTAKVVVVKSTVPVGTTFMVRDRIREKVGPEIPFEVADNPEFLKEGAAVDDFMRPDRIIVGADDEQAVFLMKALYSPFQRNHERLIVMDVRSAELTKYAANAMLAARISFMNEMTILCEAYGADIEDIRNLRMQYHLFINEQQWGRFNEIYTDDAVIDHIGFKVFLVAQ